MSPWTALRLCALGLLLLGTVLGGCDERAPAPPPADRRPPAPAPEPAGLMGQLWIPEPTQTWLTIRSGVGGPTALLPRTLGGLMVNLLGLPLRAIDEFEEERPIGGALLAPAAPPVEAGHQGTAAGPAVALAIAVRDGRRFIDQVSMGSAASHDARESPVAGVTSLVPRRPSHTDRWGLGLTLAVIDDYAIVATDAAAGIRAAAYLARTLVRQPPNGARGGSRTPAAVLHVPTGKAVELWRPSLEGALDATRAAVPELVGSLVDLGPLRQLVAEAGLLRGADLVLDLNGETMTLAAKLYPAGPDAAARLERLAAAPLEDLLDLPDDTLVAVRWWEQRATRRRSALDGAARIAELLAGDLAGEAREMLRRAVVELAEGRGDETVAGLRCTGAGLTGFVEGTVRDEAMLRRGVDTLVALRRHGAISSRLERADLELDVTKIRVPDVTGDVIRLRLSPATTPAKPTGTQPGETGRRDGGAATAAAGRAQPVPEPVELLLAVESRRFRAAGGRQARATLRLLVAPAPERSLRQRAALARALSTAPDRAWFVAFAEPLAMTACHAGRPGSAPSAPVLFALGPTRAPEAAGGWLLLQAATSAVRGIIALLEP